MKPEYLGIDPVTGLALFRAVSGEIYRVAQGESPFAAGMVPQQAPSPVAAVGPPPPGLRDTRITARAPNVSATVMPFPNFLAEPGSGGPRGQGGNPRAQRMGPAGTAQGAPVQANPSRDVTTDPAMPADEAMRERLTAARTRPNGRR
jgi:hypothetical protein